MLDLVLEGERIKNEKEQRVKMKMIRRLGIHILAFVIGLVISIYSEPALRELIQNLFKFSTNNDIYFVGKNFHFFASPFYYTSFGVMLMLFWWANSNQTINQKLIQWLLTASIFFLSLVIISILVSTSTLATCTACKDGRMGLHYNDVNYDGIIVTSVILTMFPCGFKLLNKSTRVHQPLPSE